uniref:NADH-ubiquinone oxidoreductase chain 3 n=1 Tax=Liphistius erawan TaxID=1155480 RepID=L7NVZ4_LIPER|nr:NADH dehydrogenase subunit 3 [Liphistius erawan]AFC77875.1 NADH dehydrogenase subunit 3 [Liphistius erawan]
MSLTVTLSFIFLLMSISFSKSLASDFEKLSPYECGFDPFSSPRLPFSLRFFLISIIFIIFDVEISLILPAPMSLKSPSSLIFMSSFLIILLLSLFFEWNNGALKWL